MGERRAVSNIVGVWASGGRHSQWAGKWRAGKWRVGKWWAGKWWATQTAGGKWQATQSADGQVANNERRGPQCHESRAAGS